MDTISSEAFAFLPSNGLYFLSFRKSAPCRNPCGQMNNPVGQLSFPTGLLMTEIRAGVKKAVDNRLMTA
jgi:hypothetical protein